MDHDISLPPPPRIRHRSPRGPTSLSRKTTASRSRVDDVSSLPSSDPALFSSDDIPTSLEDYSGPVEGGPTRKKRRYRGTWWGEETVDAKRKRIDFREKRNLDSGVWMGSDESSSDLLLSTSEEASPCEELLRSTTHASATALGIGSSDRADARDNMSNPYHGPQWFRRVAVRRVEEPKEHRMARALVHEHLETGQDGVDLRQISRPQ
jgi:hypothetical protein